LFGVTQIEDVPLGPDWIKLLLFGQSWF